VEQLTTLAAAQDGSVRASTGETAKQRALSAALRTDHMRPIADIAKLKLRGTPEFIKLRMPAGNARGVPLVTSALGMAEAASVHAEVLKANGCRPNFLDELRTAAAAVAKSVDGRNKHRKDRAGSTRALIAEERRARTALRVLDATVRPQLGDDEKLLGQWKAVLKVRRKRVVPTPVTTAAPEEPRQSAAA